MRKNEKIFSQDDSIVLPKMLENSHFSWYDVKVNSIKVLRGGV
jgi:hypothetical protein